MPDADALATPRADLIQTVIRKGITSTTIVPVGVEGHDRAQADATALLAEIDGLFVMLSEMPSSFTYNDVSLGLFACPRYHQFLEEIEDVAVSPHAAQALAIAKSNGRSDRTTELLVASIAAIEDAADAPNEDRPEDAALLFLGTEA